MKFKKGDKVLLVCVRNVYGIDFNCVVGRLVNIRTQKWTTNKIAQVEAKRWSFLQGEADMQSKVIDLPLDVWTLKHLTDETKTHVQSLRASCQTLAAQLQGYGPQVKPAATGLKTAEKLSSFRAEKRPKKC